MLSKKQMVYALIAAIALQITVLLMEYAGAVHPLMTGTEIKLKVIPVDPRSLFRGNYARLNYEISNINLNLLAREPRMNEVVYVTLKVNDEGLYVADGVSFEKPETGLFMRGRASHWGGQRVRYGIEAFFAPKEKALKLEKDLRTGGVAVVMVAKNGKSILKDIVPD